MLAPAELEQGTSEQTLTIFGSDFVASSSARVDGSARQTSYVSRSELRATLTGADVARAGTLQVVVVNPSPGGGTSNAALLVIRPRTNPIPAITSSTPPFLTAGGASTTVIIEGTGFVPQSIVVIENEQKSGVTYVSPTELRVVFTEREIEAGGTLALRVFNPAPGGGISNELRLENRSPTPVLSALRESQTTAGQSVFTVQVTGNGFVKNSVVRFNEAPRPTTYIDATNLTAVLSEGDLREAGTFDITVVNPTPGGGTSNALPLELVNGVPTITLLPSRGAHSGRGGLSLTVHGTRFVDGAIVLWNGSPRPTQYLSAARVTADISAADVAAPGVAQITVTNPTPGGGTSNAVELAVRGLSTATVTSSTALQVFANDLAVDDARGLIYLSIGSDAPLDANSIVALDPMTGSITRRLFVGSAPGRIAGSDNGQFLYVGLDGASAVRRVDLSQFVAGLQWLLNGAEVAGEIKVLPGVAGSVAVSRQSPGFSPPLNGVTIYDDGVARPQSSPGHTGANRIAFLDSPDTLYGFNNAHTGFGFYTVAIDANGAHHVFETGGLITGFYTQITGAAGRIYGTDGSIVDAERRIQVAQLPPSSSIAVDAELGRAFLLADGAIDVYDLNNFQRLGSVPFSAFDLEHPAVAYPHLVRWGEDGIAFVDGDELFLVRSPLFGK